MYESRDGVMAGQSTFVGHVEKGSEKQRTRSTTLETETNGDRSSWRLSYNPQDRSDFMSSR